jgi:hypothetical protein
MAVYPPLQATFVAEDNIIIGNVALYGATGGEAASLGNRRRGIEKAAAVGKRIRSDIQYTHDQPLLREIEDAVADFPKSPTHHG